MVFAAQRRLCWKYRSCCTLTARKHFRRCEVIEDSNPKTAPLPLRKRISLVFGGSVFHEHRLSSRAVCISRESRGGALLGVVPYHGESSSFLGIRPSTPSQALQRKASTGDAGPMVSRVVSPRGEHYHCRPAARKVAHPTRNERTDPKRRKGNPCHDRRNHKKRRNVTSRALIFSSPLGLIMWDRPLIPHTVQRYLEPSGDATACTPVALLSEKRRITRTGIQVDTHETARDNPVSNTKHNAQYP